jgi:hypothetical protein
MPQYEICVRGRLDPSWSTWFGDLEVSPTGAGDTLLRGRLVDQTALHGVLARIRDQALELLSLRRLDE